MTDIITEKKLIGKLRELRQIKPNKDWVLLTKSQILGQEEKYRSPISIISVLRVFFAKPGYAGLVIIFILVSLFGTFTLAQNSLPGQLLYPIKKISEKTQAVFVSEIDKPKTSLELASKRLEELTKVAETNRVQNLAPAINEFQASVSEAAKNLSKIDATSSDPAVVKRFVDQAKKIGEKVEEVKSLGVVIGEEGLEKLEKASSKLELELLVLSLENMISDLENRTLTEKQEKILSQMKELLEEEKYSEVLELFLVNQ
ncbi:MAG: DUF5667 domain-containing protein [Patescibacteria group bacterium]|nr:DUF5667 domain-containing protein [Patescibacteria group bacterium]